MRKRLPIIELTGIVLSSLLVFNFASAAPKKSLDACIGSTNAIDFNFVDMGIVNGYTSSTDPIVSSINNKGVAVGHIRANSNPPLNSYMAFTHTDQAGMQPLGVADPATHSVYTKDINNAGHVAGIKWENSTGNLTGFLYKDFTNIIDLAPLPGDVAVQVESLNNQDIVLGYSMGGVSTPVVWLPDGAPQDLGLGNNTRLYDISNSNIIVGSILDSGSHQALYFNYGSGNPYTILKVPPGAGPLYSEATAINNNGVIVGQYQYPGVYKAVAWMPNPSGGYSDAVPFNIPSPSSPTAIDINNHGWAVGKKDGINYYLYSVTNPLPGVAGTFVNLSPFTNSPNFYVTSLEEINDNCEIIGNGFDNNGVSTTLRAFKLVPK